MNYNGNDIAYRDGTWDEYKLRCQIKYIPKRGYINWQGHQYESDFVLLVPDQSTEMMKFFAAWLPDDEKEIEIVTFIGAPVIEQCRCYVRRKDEKCRDSHYLQVMSLHAEDALKNLRTPWYERFRGRRIDVNVFSANKELAAEGEK